jgi:hypothetical protein
MVEKTSVPCNIPTRDLVRAIKPLGMGYDEFLLILLEQYEPEETAVDLDDESYSKVVRRLMAEHKVGDDDIAVELINLESADDATAVSP